MSKNIPIESDGFVIDPDGPPYLGDPHAIEQVIRAFFSDAWERRIADVPNDKATAKDRADSIRFANMMLGRRAELATPMKNWNRPGVIDEWVAEKANVTEKSPTKRMATFYLSMLSEFYDAAIESANEALLPEQWEGAIQDVIHDGTRILIGTDTYALEL